MSGRPQVPTDRKGTKYSAFLLYESLEGLVKKIKTSYLSIFRGPVSAFCLNARKVTGGSNQANEKKEILTAVSRRYDSVLYEFHNW